MTEKDYEFLGKKVIDYVKTMYCPDQYVGKIRDKDNWHKFYKRTDIFQDQTVKMQTNIPDGNIRTQTSLIKIANRSVQQMVQPEDISENIFATFLAMGIKDITSF